MRPPSLPIAYLCLALSMVLVGSYVALSKPLVAVFPVLLLAWLRFAIGAVAMLHWLPAPAHEAPLSRRTHGLLFFEALIGNFLFTLCMVAGVSLTGAVAAGVVMAAIPAAVALLSWLVLKEHIGPRTWMAVALAVLGIGLYALSKQELPALATQGLEAKNTQYPTWWGPLLLVGAMLCEAIYSVLGKKLTGSLGPSRPRHLGAAGVLRPGRLRGLGVAVDDRTANRARSPRRCVHRATADQRCGGGRGGAGRNAAAAATAGLRPGLGQRGAGHLAHAGATPAKVR